VVDFTREIKQAQKTASQTPQFAAPSNSLGGDIVNAVGTGLQFYQQQQAKTDLQELTQKEAAQERLMAQGIMGLREQRQDLVNQGASRASLALRDKAYLDKYSPEMQLAIVSGVKKATGETLSSFSDEITAKEKADREASALIQANRFKLEDDAAKSLASSGMSFYDIENMSDVELRDVQLQGMILKSESDKKAAALASKIQNGTWEKMSTEKKTKEYLAVAVPDFRNSVSSDLLTTIDALGGFGKALAIGSKEALLDGIQKKRASIPELLAEQAQKAFDLGAPLSLDQQNAFKQAANDEITRAEGLISDEKYVKLFDSQNDRMLRDGLFRMAMSSNPTERGAAVSAMIMMSSNIPLGDVEKSAIAKITSKSIAGNLKFTAEDETDEDETTPVQKVQVLTEKIKLESLEGGYNDTDKQQNASIVLNAITGTSAEVTAFAKAGGINKLAGAISATEGKGISQESHAEIREALFSESYNRVGAAQARAINTKSSRMEKMSTGRGSDYVMVSTDVLKNFSLSPETGLLENISGSYVVPDSVTQYNSYMKDLFKSFEVLGVDENRIKDFKDNAMKSMMILKANNK
jgi:hypothetical protein